MSNYQMLEQGFLCAIWPTFNIPDSDPKILIAGSGKTAAFEQLMLTYIKKLPPTIKEIEAKGTLFPWLLWSNNVC